MAVVRAALAQCDRMKDVNGCRGRWWCAVVVAVVVCSGWCEVMFDSVVVRGTW